jgi:hypothetical protein
MAAVNAAVNKNYDKLSVGQMQSGIAGVTAESLGLTLNDVLQMGYTSLDAFNKDMIAAQKNAQAAWTTELSTHTNGVAEAMRTVADSSNDAIRSISQSALKAYGDMLDGFGSAQETAAFNTALMDIMTANADNAEEIMIAASSIDWSQGNVALD